MTRTISWLPDCTLPTLRLLACLYLRCALYIFLLCAPFYRREGAALVLEVETVGARRFSGKALKHQAMSSLPVSGGLLIRALVYELRGH